jgi:predicted 3-demethylubiquinone-9 3-methyltransferase (glyoxalase superfamily)
MQKIVPHLWFDSNAEEAVHFYASAFQNSKIDHISRYGDAGAEVSGRPRGSVMTVDFKLNGQDFLAINGGPYFKFTPAISFFVKCETEAEIDALWPKFSDGGTVLMGSDAYPFSEKFGWINDKFGVSWQLSLSREKQTISPFLMFVGDNHGKAEEAISFYTSLFESSKIIGLERHVAEGGEVAGTVKLARFLLQNQEFMILESALNHAFTFTPAISFLVNCETQEEIDRLWDKFTADGEIEQCGWLRDKFGVSWQIVPTALGEMMTDPDPSKVERVMKAMLQMKKIDLKTLRDAYGQ